MKILILAIVLFFYQSSFLFAKPFCQENDNEFSLGLAAGFIGASFIGYKIGKGEMSFDDGEKEFDKHGKLIFSKLKNFCSVQGNKNKNLSHMDILKLVVTNPNFGVASAGGESGSSSGISKFERFLIRVDTEIRNSTKLRKCMIKDSKKDVIKFIESKFSELESLSGNSKKYPMDVMEKVFKNDTKELMGVLGSSYEKCK